MQFSTENRIPLWDGPFAEPKKSIVIGEWSHGVKRGDAVIGVVEKSQRMGTTCHGHGNFQDDFL